MEQLKRWVTLLDTMQNHCYIVIAPNSNAGGVVVSWFQ